MARGKQQDRLLQGMRAHLHKLQFWCGAELVLCWAGGRDADGLIPVLQCLCKFIVDPRYARLLLGVAHRVLDTYAGEVSSWRFATHPCYLSLAECHVAFSWHTCCHAMKQKQGFPGKLVIMRVHLCYLGVHLRVSDMHCIQAGTYPTQVCCSQTRC